MLSHATCFPYMNIQIPLLLSLATLPSFLQSLHVTQPCQRSSFQCGPNMIRRSVMEQGLIWRLTAETPRPAETGGCADWQGKGRLLAPGREHIQQLYMASFLLKTYQPGMMLPRIRNIRRTSNFRAPNITMYLAHGNGYRKGEREDD